MLLKLQQRQLIKENFRYILENITVLDPRIAATYFWFIQDAIKFIGLSQCQQIFRELYIELGLDSTK